MRQQAPQRATESPNERQFATPSRELMRVGLVDQHKSRQLTVTNERRTRDAGPGTQATAKQTDASDDAIARHSHVAATVRDESRASPTRINQYYLARQPRAWTHPAISQSPVSFEKINDSEKRFAYEGSFTVIELPHRDLPNCQCCTNARHNCCVKCRKKWHYSYILHY